MPRRKHHHVYVVELSKDVLYEPRFRKNNPDYVDGDQITPAGVERLKASMPHADLTALEESPYVSKMPELFTVEAIVKYVESKLAAA